MTALKGLYIVSDMFPFHLQARKVCPHAAVEMCQFMITMYPAEYLDHGVHIISFHFTIRIWLYGRAYEVSLHPQQTLAAGLELADSITSDGKDASVVTHYMRLTNS